MSEGPTVGERRLLNRLTVIKLAIQILSQKTELSAYQLELARTAIEATDELTADLLDYSRALRSGAQPVEWAAEGELAGRRPR